MSATLRAVVRELVEAPAAFLAERRLEPGRRTADGKLFASDAPGLGVAPDFDSLGAPVAVYEEVG